MTDAATPPEATPGGGRYAVVGLGASGRAAIDFLRRAGHAVLAMDTREAPPALAAVRAAHPEVDIVTGRLDDASLARCAVVVVSPGVPLESPALARARSAGSEVIGDVELFARHARAPVVAITGTNGKSTVTTLVADMLAAGGRDVRRGANLGTPALDLLGEREPECYVLELSSFQLETCASLRPAVAAILNVAPDHIDRHGSLERYVAAKARVLTHAQSVVLNADDPIVSRLPAAGARFEFTLGAPGVRRYGLRRTAQGEMLAGDGHDFIARDALALSGTHNVANALAAIAICEARHADRSAMTRTLARFSGLPHRAQPVASIAGVRYVDDSKATNPGAACASIGGVLGTRGGVLIAGGEPKGADFAGFADVACAHAHTVVLIGRAAGLIEQALGGRVACVHAPDMAAAVRAAAAAARPGESVLLAPACASFDMFSDYAARGDAFRAAVAALEAR